MIAAAPGSVRGRMLFHVRTIAGPAIMRRLDGRRPGNWRVRSWRAGKVRGLATGTRSTTHDSPRTAEWRRWSWRRIAISVSLTTFSC